MKILLQTTIPFNADDWHAGRFSLLAEELRSAGHEVTARDREDQPDGCDRVLSRLSETDFDQVWLMAVDVGNGLADGDVQSIVDFRESGGGVLAARDHQDLGASLEKLHSIGIFNHFHSLNPENPDRRENDDCDNPNISYPNYHSGSNGDYQKITPDEPIHELLRSRLAPNGVIEYFPAHPHEGAVGVPPETDYARVIARGRSTVSGRLFNLAVAVDGQPCKTRAGSQGRAVAESTFHHFADLNWDVDRGAPSFVTDKPGLEMKHDPTRLQIFKDYVRNIATWLGSRRRRAQETNGHDTALQISRN